MSSTATTVIVSTRPQGVRLSPGPSNKTHLHQIYNPGGTTFSRASSRSDMSSAAYYGQRSVGYESGREAYTNMSAPMNRSWVTAKDTPSWQEDYSSSYSQHSGQQRQQYQPPQAQVPAQMRYTAGHSASHTVSKQTTRASTPGSSHSSHPASGASTNRDVQSMVMHSLQIPTRISPTAGNLADFSAQLTCLFWFESPQVLEAAEKARLGSEDRAVPLPRLSANALPTEPFRKWVTSVLTTTQVTQNVILLALMFVYRLKMTNPSVRGRPGSEYRLLTVALMLGNKFLDDNTYTNKTWAEVSGISVQEIHVMEVEFLSNMRYALLASSEQWKEWLDKLSSYHVFCERVANAPSPSARMVPSPTLLIPSPTGGSGFSPVSSPTAYQYTPPAPRAANGRSYYSPPAASAAPVLYHQDAVAGGALPLAQRPELGNDNDRKRSCQWDEQSAEHPAKRAYLGPSTASAPLPAPDARRLPVPSLTLNTSAQTPVTQMPYSVPTYSIPPPAPYTVSLPPLEPGVRAMATVYQPPVSASWAPAQGSMTSGGAAQSNVQPSAPLVTPTSQFPPISNGTYGTPTKRLSPVNTLTPANAYNTSSPLHEYSQNSGFHTPISHSPSIYLQQRNSPYKPIRNVRTLLNPPPPSSMQNYQLPAIPPSQMHYQPIGRRNDQRTGIVPEYRTHDNFGTGSHYGGVNSQYGAASRHNGMTPIPAQASQHQQQQQHQQHQQHQHRYPNLIN